MIRKNPRGDLPEIHHSAFVDPTAILCGLVIVEENVFIGFNSVLFNCTVADGCVVRFNAVVDGCHLPSGFHVRSTERIGPDTDLASLRQVTPDASEFSEDVARTNNELVLGYKHIQHEF
jgi:carbonic anhydrase/acetyltransferase-like protein (isoleucine patch superfamily)